MTQTDGKIYCVLGLEESVLLNGVITFFLRLNFILLYLFKLIFIGVEFLYNVVLVSTVHVTQQMYG